MVADDVIAVERASVLTMILMFLLGGGVSVLVGFAIAGNQVFDLARPVVQYLLVGSGCALVFALHQWRGLMLSILIALIVSAIFGYTAGRLFVQTFIHSSVAMLATVFMGELMWGKTFSRVMFGRFIYVGLVLAVASMFSTIVLTLAYGHNLFSSQLLSNIARSGLIGLSIGFGFELAEFITGRSRRRARL